MRRTAAQRSVTQSSVRKVVPAAVLGYRRAMKRLVLVAALLGGACGTTDDRPRTLRYITQTILAPTCAIAQCHSAFKQEVGDEFDTIEAARRDGNSSGGRHPAQKPGGDVPLRRH